MKGSDEWPGDKLGKSFPNSPFRIPHLDRRKTRRHSAAATAQANGLTHSEGFEGGLIEGGGGGETVGGLVGGEGFPGLRADQAVYFSFI